MDPTPSFPNRKLLKGGEYTFFTLKYRSPEIGFSEDLYLSVKKKEPAMIYATANAHPCIPIRNLSTTHKHYRTYTDLCSTTEDTLETCCNLSTATDLQHECLRNLQQS